MKPKNKLRIATSLMLLGLTPFMLGIYWICAVLTYTRQMGGADAFLMMGVLFITYMCAVVVGGGSAIWSTVLTHQTPGLDTRSTTVIRVMVWIAVAAPLFWYIKINI